MIPEAAVEAAAKATFALAHDADNWGILPEGIRSQYREEAMPALEAAFPSLLAEAWEEGYGASTTDSFAASRGFVGKLPNPYEEIR